MGGVQVLGAGVAQLEVIGQAGAVPPAGGGELGLGAQDAGGDHGADEVALAGWLGSEEAGQSEATESLQHGQDGAVGARADDLEGVGGVAQGLAGQMGFEQVDRGIGEVGEIGEGFFLDPALVVAEGAAQELGVVGLAVLDGADDGDVHGGHV